MSGTDQFPPRHLLPDDQDDEGGIVKGNDPAQGQGQQQDQSGPTSTQLLGLPAPPTIDSNDDPSGGSRTLSVGSGEEGGNKIALDELGPMLVSEASVGQSRGTRDIDSFCYHHTTGQQRRHTESHS